MRTVRAEITIFCLGCAWTAIVIVGGIWLINGAKQPTTGISYALQQQRR